MLKKILLTFEVEGYVFLSKSRNSVAEKEN